MSDEILKECSSDCGCMAEIGTIIHENDTVYDFKLEGNKEKVLETFAKYEETINATCKNLSATGMSIELKDGSLKINDSIQVILNDNQEAVPALNATAKVVRIINEDLKQYGIAFIASE